MLHISRRKGGGEQKIHEKDLIGDNNTKDQKKRKHRSK